YAVVAACLCISLMSAIFLSRVSFFLYLIGIPLVLAYSGFRIGGRRVKEIFVLKNIYTGLTICLAFLIGAWAADTAAFAVFPYVPLIFLLGFTLNALGDIRGYDGDIAAGVRTIPVVFGVGTAKLVLYSVSGFFIIYVLAMNSMLFLPLIPFMLMISIFVSMGKHKHARFSILSSFIFLFAFLVFANMFRGI
ncbi:MAG: UbiA family prenyltransferase, partial [Candidatus Aenigmarchaeota archaeon]|nr:UbiA family prenyltransferase [Candidatus Aenigmarchaeota archaeon]